MFTSIVAYKTFDLSSCLPVSYNTTSGNCLLLLYWYWSGYKLLTHFGYFFANKARRFADYDIPCSFAIIHYNHMYA